MITVVTKPFESNGEQIESGRVVDSSAWRNESRLINCRFLREATESEVADFKKHPPKPNANANAKTKSKSKAKAVRPSKKAKTAKAKTSTKTTAKKTGTKTPAPPATPPPAGNDDHLSI